jgi:hypothetical protein
MVDYFVDYVMPYIRPPGFSSNSGPLFFTFPTAFYTGRLTSASSFTGFISSHTRLVSSRWCYGLFKSSATIRAALCHS